MTYRIIDSVIGAQGIEEVSTTQNFPLGTRVKARDATHGVGEFIYLKGVASGAQYAWVTYNADDWSTVLLAANAIGPVGVMMSTLDATTDFGWVQIYGKVASGKCLTSFADNGRVYATATAGSIDDASVAGDVVHGARGASTTTVSSGVAEFEIHYPFMEDRVSIIS
jgi:hypothetical protein